MSRIAEAVSQVTWRVEKGISPRRKAQSFQVPLLVVSSRVVMTCPFWRPLFVWKFLLTKLSSSCYALCTRLHNLNEDCRTELCTREH